ncbi:MAG: hypothetical protein H6826_14475 [Planctomycetes bacterium]|nr:hypothetical protein [Planctomycetota bacterium]
MNPADQLQHDDRPIIPCAASRRRSQEADALTVACGAMLAGATTSNRRHGKRRTRTISPKAAYKKRPARR